MGYIYVWEHSRGGRHIDVDCSPTFEDLYNPKARFQDICVVSVFSFSSIRFLDAPTPLTVHFRSSMSGQSYEIR